VKKLISIIVCLCFITMGCGSMIRGKSSQPIKPGLPNIQEDMILSCGEIQREINKLDQDKIKNEKRRKVGVRCNIMNTFSGILIALPFFLIDVELSDYNLANDVIDARIKDLLKYGYENECDLIIPELPKPKVYKIDDPFENELG